MNPGASLHQGHLLDGRYRIRKVLGTGGMGRVYLSNDTRLANRPVAVKEMVVGDGVRERKAIEDFAREARVLALLSHPGIPSVIDYFVENGRHYLVMEFVAGGDLDELLRKAGPGGRMTEGQVLIFAHQILEVLDFLHSQKPPIVYRDLKPANIMIDKDGRAMLIDFGIARFLPPGGRGTQIGSVGYAPPEQYMGKTEPRSDLYSLGATIHHLLTGRDPQLEAPFSFPPLLDLAPQVSRRTAEVVMRALDKDIEKRPRSAREMARELGEPPQGQSLPVAGVSGGLAGRTDSAISSMDTAVLPRPGVPPPAVAKRSAPASRIGGSADASMPTVVLDRPSPRGHGSTASPRASDHGLQKAYELAEKARLLIGRGLASLDVSAPKPSPRPSATAKTRELKPARAESAPRKSSPVRTQTPRKARRRASRSAGSAGSPPPESSVAESERRILTSARIVIRNENKEFNVFAPRTVIGRSHGTAGPPDIDLGGLRRGADRVSRRHAEVIKRGPDYFVRDLGSLHGTWIVGRGRLGRDQLYRLRDGDKVVVGRAVLEFRKGGQQ